MGYWHCMSSFHTLCWDCSSSLKWGPGANFVRLFSLSHHFTVPHLSVKKLLIRQLLSIAFRWTTGISQPFPNWSEITDGEGILQVLAQARRSQGTLKNPRHFWKPHSFQKTPFLPDLSQEVLSLSFFLLSLVYFANKTIPYGNSTFIRTKAAFS